MPLTEQELSQIRSRWQGASIVVDGWGRVPEVRRERVLSELEEIARQAHDTNELASDIRAAVDALDVMGRVADLDLVAHAMSDIRALLQVIHEKGK
jgi:hypothetical protein